MCRHKLFFTHAVGELRVFGLNLQPSMVSIFRPEEPLAHISDGFVGLSGDSVVFQILSHLLSITFASEWVCLYALLPSRQPLPGAVAVGILFCCMCVRIQFPVHAALHNYFFQCAMPICNVFFGQLLHM